MRLVFVGPPGVGKGTQCRRLSEHLKIPHVSTGVMLRGLRHDSVLGSQVHEVIDRGSLAPDELVTKLLIARLADPDASSGYLLDGYPRTVRQAELLSEYLESVAQEIDAVIVLKAPVDLLLDRILKRAASEDRADDDRETVSRRLNVYRDQTAPVVGYYQDRGLIREVDATGSADEVFEAILAVVR
ncbi:MAG: adenylate kinase [Planctomycetota bacterium]